MNALAFIRNRRYTIRPRPNMSDKIFFFERILFKYRIAFLFSFLFLTIFFVYQTYDLEMDTSMKKMVPLQHEYIKNLYKHKDELSLGNDIRIAVEHTKGDIFDKEYIETLKQVTEEGFYLPGVNKGKVMSLWTPNVRWTEADEAGFSGGEVIPPEYDGSEGALIRLQQNVLKSDQIGRLVADDLRSSIVYLPLIEQDSSKPNSKNDDIDYSILADELENNIRKQFESDTIKIHIIGFAKKVGDLIEGVEGVIGYFIITVIITFHLLVFDCRCVRCAGVILVGSLMAVSWQLGVVTLMRKGMVLFRESEHWQPFIEAYPGVESIQFGIDPYSMLIPFLVFAIAVSHGVQYAGEMSVKVASGDTPFNASVNTFRALFLPGLLALISDAIGFITLWFIDIGVIRELAITASVGVAAIILTKLMFVPIALSFVGIGDRAIEYTKKKMEKPSRVWLTLSHLVEPRFAAVVVLVAFVGAGIGSEIRKDLRVGDLDAGAPELHPDSRYNLDNHFITQNYSISADVLVVMVETPPETCSSYRTLQLIDQFMWRVERIDEVESVVSLASVLKHILSGFNEGSIKWFELPKMQEIIGGALTYLPTGYQNPDCSLVPVILYLSDHKATTLSKIVTVIEEFAAENNDEKVAKFILASGNAGAESAINQIIASAEQRILIMVYGVVCFMIFVSFRSWRPVVCIVLPLFMTSILCEAVMTEMGMGVKVATLPVIALGVGIGVDYGIYLFSKMRYHLNRGVGLKVAYLEALRVTGKSIVFTGVALSLSVGTWAFSDIKFQADIGLLLTFMFLWNMVGAIIVLPALATFLIKPAPASGDEGAEI